MPRDQSVPPEVQQWVAERSARGLSIEFWACLGFIDDSSFACFDFFEDTVWRVATEIWVDYKMTIAESNASNKAGAANLVSLKPLSRLLVSPTCLSML